MKYRDLLATTALCALAFADTAIAGNFDIPQSDLKTALDAYARQSGVPLMVSADAIRGIRSAGVKGSMPADDALEHILAGTGFVIRHHSLGAVTITRGASSAAETAIDL